MKRQADSSVHLLAESAAKIQAALEFLASIQSHFTRNDYFPFDRKQLQKYDPATLKLIGNLWGEERAN